MADIQVYLVLEVQPTLLLSVLALLTRHPFSALKLFELCSKLQSPHWLIDRISDQDSNITSAVVLSSLCKLFEIFLCEFMRIFLEGPLEHAQSK